MFIKCYDGRLIPLAPSIDSEDDFYPLQYKQRVIPTSPTRIIISQYANSDGNHVSKVTLKRFDVHLHTGHTGTVSFVVWLRILLTLLYKGDQPSIIWVTEGKILDNLWTYVNTLWPTGLVWAGQGESHGVMPWTLTCSTPPYSVGPRSDFTNLFIRISQVKW